MNNWIPLTDGPAYVLLLSKPADIFENTFEGHQRGRLCIQMKKFVTEETPESALEDEEKFKTPLRQLKDRGGKVRGLGTWCEGDEFDLFVVQVVFDKNDEGRVYAVEDRFASRGSDLQEKFEPMTTDEIQTKVKEWRARDDVLVFDDTDFDDS